MPDPDSIHARQLRRHLAKPRRVDHQGAHAAIVHPEIDPLFEHFRKRVIAALSLLRLLGVQSKNHRVAATAYGFGYDRAPVVKFGS